MNEERVRVSTTRWLQWVCPAIFMVFLSFGQVFAIEIDPRGAHIDTALEQGKTAALQRVPPDRLYAWFGPLDDLEPRGFLMTKVVGLRVMAAHFALRGEHPSESEIKSILEEPSLLVSVTLFGDRPTFAVDSYMLLRQQDRTIKPSKVRFDGRAARTRMWPTAPRYRAKIVASFPYAEIDPHAKTRISVFPSAGGEVTFEVDFSRIE
jgi:hypothetical protein